MRRHGLMIRTLNVCLALAMLVNWSAALAQTGATAEASLKVSVVDPNGAAVALARVVVKMSSGIEREARTSQQGEASFARLGAGTAQLFVEAEGFAARTVDDVRRVPAGVPQARHR